MVQYVLQYAVSHVYTEGKKKLSPVRRKSFPKNELCVPEKGLHARADNNFEMLHDMPN
jgi:hypothetical protein